MKNQTKILFICDKWCAGNKDYGVSEWEKGLRLSLEATMSTKVETFHFDDYYIQNGVKGDAAVLEKIASYKPEMICFITNKMPGTAFNVAEFSTLDQIRDVYKVPMIAIWGDLEIKEQVDISLAMLPYVKVNIATACSSVIDRINKHDKYLYTWVPRDPRIFNNPNKERDIDISYVGSPKRERYQHIMYLIKHGIKVIYGGGERQEHLTTEQYADRYQRSKITLSFSRASASHVVNARPFEAMPCGAMLLEQESFEMMKLYTPYIDYVPYSSKKDMLIKAKYFLEHDEEREKIARSGQRKTEELYSAKRFWEIAIGRALGIKQAEEYSFANKPIPEESLNKLYPITAFEMKVLNSLCATKPGFFIYKAFNTLYWKEKFYFLVGKSRVISEKILPKKAFDFVLGLKRKIIRSY